MVVYMDITVRGKAVDEIFGDLDIPGYFEGTIITMAYIEVSCTQKGHMSIGDGWTTHEWIVLFDFDKIYMPKIEQYKMQHKELFEGDGLKPVYITYWVEDYPPQVDEGDVDYLLY